MVDFVEAEFWACHPLPGLFEEVTLGGEHVRYRLGPFAVDHEGHRSYEPDFQGRPEST